jgi:hypothetical protein
MVAWHRVATLTCFSLLAVLTAGSAQGEPLREACTRVARDTNALGVGRPSLLRAPAPEYPATITDAGPLQSVYLELYVCADGRPDSASIHVVRTTDARFNQLAINAMFQSRWDPMRVWGTPVASPVQHEVRFKRAVKPAKSPRTPY